MMTITGEYEYDEPTEDELYQQWLENQMWLDAEDTWKRLDGRCPLCDAPITLEDVFHATPCICEICGGEYWAGGTSCDCDQPHCVDCGAQAVDGCCCCGDWLCPQCFECSCGFCNDCLKSPDFADRMEAIYAEQVA